MFVRQHVHRNTEWELLKWAILIVLASVIALGVLTSVAGAADVSKLVREPGPLPNEVEDLASPMDVPSVGEPLPSADLALQVWRALELQHGAKYDDAVAAWQSIDLPCETTVWKQVALGQAYLATTEIESASEVLLDAKDLDPENPVVHYFLGLLRLEQACVAEQWQDAVGPTVTAFVAHRPTEIAPNSKSMYELTAVMELEEAIKLAPDVWMDQPLVPTDWPTRAALAPTVGDLLLAVGAKNFEAKAHNVLSYIYLEQDSLEMAEGHMDSAAAGGLSVVGYAELGERYATAGRHTDAARAYVKAMNHTSHKLDSARKAWDNLRDAWLEVW